MEKFVYLNELYDLYGELLTDKQKTYFEEYYFHNLSLGEISEKHDVSRNAIFHQLKIIEEKLKLFEKKLQLFVKKEKINDILKVIDNKEIRDTLEKLF